MSASEANKEYLENMAFISEYCGLMSNRELLAWCVEQDRLWQIVTDVKEPF